MPLPADRGHLSTEQRHPGSRTLDTLDVEAAIALVVDDHRVVCDAVAAAAAALGGLVPTVVERMRRGGRLVYVGAGTSGRLGVLDAAECPPTFQSDSDQVIGIIAGGDAALRRSSEGLEDDPAGAVPALEARDIGVDDTVVGIAAGGTTPYVLGALRWARSVGAATAMITCVPDVRVDVDHIIVLDTGPEILTGSTRLKAGTATKLALNTLSTVVFTQLGKVCGNLMVDLRATNEKLRDRAIRILREFCPELDRPEAATRLDAAGGHLKVAIVMTRCGVSVNEARRRLDIAGERLREAVDGTRV
ncbi:MAG: N-acetylmuramic acid 6-phosphate etherase [Phycisphaerales bacterium]|nr:N-acetylmuramic acid 6-phosphate etherase [Phycisphaerales bacterium]